MVAKKEQNLLKSIVDVLGFLLVAIAYLIQAIYKSLLPKAYQYQKNIRGEIALVTGGGSGLGRLLALRLANLGAKVVLWDVNEKGVQETKELVEGIGGVAFGYKCDISNSEDVYRVADKVREDVGDVTILFNNAGVVSGHLLLDTPDDLIKRTFDVNIIAHFWTVKAFLPKMMKLNHGHIVTIASMAGHTGISKLIDYCASKHAAVGFDEALRAELDSLGFNGIKTTVICPYFIQSTGMFGTVQSRFVPRLKSNDVADRIIEALVREDMVVMIPGHFALGILIKKILPWSVVSMFLRGIVPDAMPQQLTGKASETNGPVEEYNKGDSITKAVASSMNGHSAVESGKNM